MPPSVQRPRAISSRTGGSQVVELPVAESETSLVAALQAGRAEARKALFDRYAKDVERILFRVLGPDSEAPDLLHDVFVAALQSIGTLRDPRALPGWLRGIAVNKARKLIVKRQRWKLIQFFAPSDLPETEALVPSAEISEAMRSTYEVLGAMPADERVAFALRMIDGMELTQVAEACGVSLATIKRRLARAHESFTVLARSQPALAEWLEGGEP
jgi:RNA polymerase sigma-70 factor (ECF subfamily)